MNFIKKWLRWQFRYFSSLVAIALSVFVFGWLAVTFWPNYALGTTAIFTVLIIWVIARI